MPTIWLSITDCVRDNAIKETPLLTLLSRQLFALNIDSDNAIHCIGVQRYRFLEMSWYFATSIIGHFHLAFLPRLNRVLGKRRHRTSAGCISLLYHKWFVACISESKHALLFDIFAKFTKIMRAFVEFHNRLRSRYQTEAACNQLHNSAFHHDKDSR